MTSKVGSTRGLLILLVCIDLFKSSASYSVSDMNYLLVKLFNDSEYNKLVQPATFVVKAQYKLESVNSLDIKKQVLSTTGFFTLEWKDDRLKWDFTSSGYIPYIFVPEDRVWHPDLLVLNSVQELQKNLGAERPVQIKYDGTLVWKPIAVLSTFCVTYFFFFPFDRHNCSLELTSSDYLFATTSLSFLEHPIIIDRKPQVQVQADWEIVNSYTYTTFSKLTFVLELKRLPGHYIMIVIFPTILTAILTYVAFFLPLKSGVRIGYIVTVVLAYVVLLTFFADTMPSSTKYPSVLVVSFTITLGMAFFLIIITIFVTRLYNKPKRSMAPKWMHSLVRKFRKLKLKLKCRGRRIHHLEKNLTIEDGGPTKKVDNEKKSSLLKPYSNKELAEFFDYMLFIVFTVLYILVLAGIPIAAAVWYKKEMDYYYGQ